MARMERLPRDRRRMSPTENRRRILLREVNRIVSALREQYRPGKIVLFGSLATGRIHEWSDIDLLIVKDTYKRPIDRCMEVYRIVQPKVGLDVFVYTPDEFAALVMEKFPIVVRALKEGKVLYEERNRRVVENS